MSILRKPSNKVSDNRRSNRIGCSFPVTIQLTTGEKLAAWTINISPEGLRVQLARTSNTVGSLKVGDRLTLVLNSPFFRSRCVKLHEYRVVGTTNASNTHMQLGLELACAVGASAPSDNFSFIRPSEYVVPSSLEMEFLKTLELIDFKLPDQTSKVILVTAAQEHAGVSTFSWWFASCITRMVETRVLFIDGNLRQRESYDTSVPQPGLINVLRRKYDCDEAIVDLGPGCPSILNCGNAGDYLAGDISVKMLSETFAKLREKFDYIIVDSLPVIASPFSLMLAREADGTLLVVENKTTKRDVAKTALDLLNQTGCNVLGALLNRS